MLLKVWDASVEEVSDGQLLKAVHGEGLPWTGLAIGEHCHYSLVEHQIQDRSDRKEVKVLSWLFMRECVIEDEFWVVNELSDPIDPVLALVDNDRRVCARYAVDLSYNLNYWPYKYHERAHWQKLDASWCNNRPWVSRKEHAKNAIIWEFLTGTI